MTGLEFIDCAGLTVLVEAAARAARRGETLSLIGGSGQVQRLLALTGCPEGAECRGAGPRLELVEATEREGGGDERR